MPPEQHKSTIGDYLEIIDIIGRGIDPEIVARFRHAIVRRNELGDQAQPSDMLEYADSLKALHEARIKLTENSDPELAKLFKEASPEIDKRIAKFGRMANASEN